MKVKIVDTFKRVLDIPNNPAGNDVGVRSSTSPSASKNEESQESDDVPPAIESLPPPPDGGVVAWLQVLASFCANVNGWGIVNAFGVYQTYYQENLLKERSPFQISWIQALSGSLLLFGTNFFGGFVDLGYMKVMGFLGCILQFVALMLLSWSKTYAEIILTQGLFVGIISSILFLLTISSVAPYFSTKRPFAIGLGASGSSIGGTIYSCMARKLITEVGFGWSTRIIAFIELVTTAVMFLSLKRRLPPTPRKAFVATECLSEVPFMLFCIGNTFAYIGLYIFYVYFESYALSIDPNENSFYYMTAIINAGSAFGRILPALLATKVGALNVLVPMELISLVLTFCWMATENKGGIITLGILFGFFTGPLLAFLGTVVSALTTNFNRLGIRLSFAFTFASFGFVLGPPIAGIIQREYGWFWLKLYASLSFVASFICHVALRFVVSGPKLKAFC